jgi:predicted transcriptional regulator
MDIVVKRMVSLRLDEELLALLEQVAETPGTMYWQRDRTWLVENAIRLIYEPIVASQETKKPTQEVASESKP